MPLTTSDGRSSGYLHRKERRVAVSGENAQYRVYFVFAGNHGDAESQATAEWHKEFPFVTIIDVMVSDVRRS